MSDRLFLEDFEPRSTLVVPEHRVPRAAFPVVDAHNHLTHRGWGDHDPAQLVQDMDAANVATVVNLSGSYGDALKRNLERFDQGYPGRFATFCNVDWQGVGGPGWLEKTLAQLESDVAAGARGLKVFKELGLRVRDTRHKLVLPDDPRLSDIWDQAAELGVPVLIHTADPVAFFQPLDRTNEQYDCLHNHPDWRFYGPEFPPFEELIASLFNLVGAHPKTTFITAHVCCYAENLGFASEMLDRHPNLYTDFAARIAQLGRAPYSARRWFLKYADRILFGTDVGPSPAWYGTYFRWLETADEYFDHDPGPGIGEDGRWKIYGLSLPDEVLKKVYHDNAARLLRLH